jgi:hypothetical protein
LFPVFVPRLCSPSLFPGSGPSVTVHFALARLRHRHAPVHHVCACLGEVGRGVAAQPRMRICWLGLWPGVQPLHGLGIGLPSIMHHLLRGERMIRRATKRMGSRRPRSAALPPASATRVLLLAGFDARHSRRSAPLGSRPPGSFEVATVVRNLERLGFSSSEVQERPPRSR